MYLVVATRCSTSFIKVSGLIRLKSIMIQKFPIILSGNSFFSDLRIIPKIMLTTPMIPKIMLTIYSLYRVHCSLCSNNA